MWYHAPADYSAFLWRYGMSTRRPVAILREMALVRGSHAPDQVKARILKALELELEELVPPGALAAAIAQAAQKGPVKG